ncbi:DUF2279 domain-containing protein [Winogradskyella sp. 3972H.M.0a.05]|uniref:DUF2279 domain-containing protein n=1 Tax=Winogradskyella sp. 3972H.M.0a.05 TaxID=2950277 RepID=UPI0033983DCA
MHTRLFNIVLALLISSVSFSQSGFNEFLKPSDTLNTKRKNAVLISGTSLAGLTLVGLDRLWYKDFPRSSFNAVNDNDEWLQVDKIGHLFSAYQLTRVGAESFEWAGASKNSQLIFGSALSLGFLTTVEIFDGYSAEWGFSWGDFAANALGSGIYVGQELLWDEQRVTVKYSFHQTSLAPQNPEKLGDGLFEEFLKDYNGQTYWLSANIHSFFKDSKLPKWLNIAVGYGAEGMLTGRSDASTFFPNQDGTRQFYLSLDVDLSRIQTNSRFLRTIFSIINVLKIPSPTLEFSSKRGTVVHLLYF